ncbi:Zinc finger protein 37-like [Papilio xuthus]|uniref:Zinc finger protein 37-like n=1 Tax=Papilio xuthus TaxID=66420 RepID=A0A0N0P9R5_PAPXU|nr:Zinc finger protein 37-like [Papilio xuthus]
MRKKNKELKRKLEESKKEVEKIVEEIPEEIVTEKNLEEGSIEQYNTLEASTKYVDPVKENEDLPNDSKITKEMKKDAKQLLKMYKKLLKYNDMTRQKDPNKKKKKKQKKSKEDKNKTEMGEVGDVGAVGVGDVCDVGGPRRGPRCRERLPERPQCVECGKMFSSKKTYRYHLNVLHKGENRYPCPRCGKVYQWKSNLGRHMRSHKARDSGELHCSPCGKLFASVATYRQHLRVSRRHVPETEFSFTCDECGKKFVSKTRLRDHIDWEHLHNIKFRCHLCNKAYKCHTSLYVHLQNVHRDKDARHNLCHVCGKSYQNAAKLKYHIVAMHTSETPYRCERCGAAFGWYSSLYRHVREVHYKVYDTSLCVRVCWECRAALRRFQMFKSQVQRSYSQLLHVQVQNGSTKLLLSKEPKLKIQQVVNINYPETIVKEESDDDIPIDKLKREAIDEMHCEPETFVRDLNLPHTKKESSKKKNKTRLKKKIKKKKNKMKADVISDSENWPDVTEDMQKMDDSVLEDKKIANCDTDIQIDVNIQDRKEITGSVGEVGDVGVVGEVGEVGDVGVGDVCDVGGPRRGPRCRERVPERPQCVECGKMFSSKKTYRYHLK